MTKGESMQSMSHQMMGYDRAITMFSPDGRLLQVEYAKKTVRQGSTAIAMICADGVLFVTDKRVIDSLIIPEAVEKIWQIDEHLGVTASGILSDARVLIERAQLKAQQHRITYDSPIDVESHVIPELIILDDDGFFRIRLFYNNLNELITKPSSAAKELTDAVGPMVDFVIISLRN